MSNRCSAHYYVAKVVALLMTEALTSTELRNCLNCDKTTMRRVIEALSQLGVIYAMEWPRTSQGPIIPKWTLNPTPFKYASVERPKTAHDLRKEAKLARDAISNSPQYYGPPKPIKRRKVRPLIMKMPKFRSVEDVRRKADFDIPVGIPNSIFDVR